MELVGQQKRVTSGNNHAVDFAGEFLGTLDICSSQTSAQSTAEFETKQLSLQLPAIQCQQSGNSRTAMDPHAFSPSIWCRRVRNTHMLEPSSNFEENPTDARVSVTSEWQSLDSSIAPPAASLNYSVVGLPAEDSNLRALTLDIPLRSKSRLFLSGEFAPEFTVVESEWQVRNFSNPSRGRNSDMPRARQFSNHKPPQSVNTSLPRDEVQTFDNNSLYCPTNGDYAKESTAAQTATFVSIGPQTACTIPRHHMQSPWASRALYTEFSHDTLHDQNVDSWSMRRTRNFTERNNVISKKSYGQNASDVHEECSGNKHLQSFSSIKERPSQEFEEPEENSTDFCPANTKDEGRRRPCAAKACRIHPRESRMAASRHAARHKRFTCIECTSILEGWAMQNGLQPTKDEKFDLLRSVGMSADQLKFWFSNRRRRAKPIRMPRVSHQRTKQPLNLKNFQGPGKSASFPHRNSS